MSWRAAWRSAGSCSWCPPCQPGFLPRRHRRDGRERPLPVEVLERLHSLLIEQGKHHPDLRGMGTTLDSRPQPGPRPADSRQCGLFAGVHLLREGQLHRLTRDHTYVQLLVDSGQLSQEEAANCGARHVLVTRWGA